VGALGHVLYVKLASDNVLPSLTPRTGDVRVYDRYECAEIEVPSLPLSETGQ
jgi:hypothetical protein